MSTQPHQFHCRVYYEDTDLAGIVYYANYLKFIERARSEMIREAGLDQTQMKQDDGLVFAVRRVEADYMTPAKFDDELAVETTVSAQSGARITLQQDVKRGGTLLFSAIVELACLRPDGRPARLPASLRGSLQRWVR